MIDLRTVCICDVCGKTVEAAKVDNEQYVAPRDWGKGAANTDVDICPDCLRKLKPSGFGVTRAAI